MNKRKVTVPFLAFLTILTAAAPDCKAADIFAYLTRYTCNPKTCYQTLSGTGFFSVRMGGTGFYQDEWGNPLARRSQQIGVDSVGCTLTVKLEAWVDANAFDPNLGYGIDITGQATQLGIITLFGGYAQYFSRRVRFGGTDQQCV